MGGTPDTPGRSSNEGTGSLQQVNQTQLPYQDRTYYHSDQPSTASNVAVWLGHFELTFINCFVNFIFKSVVVSGTPVALRCNRKDIEGVKCHSGIPQK